MNTYGLPLRVFVPLRLHVWARFRRVRLGFVFLWLLLFASSVVIQGSPR